MASVPIEELIAGAHAECINTTATVSLEQNDGGFAITAAHLDAAARVPGADAEGFDKAANAAKTGCTVSEVLKAQISMDAKLES